MAIHTAITAAATAPWYETSAVAAYLADLDINELYLCRPMVVMGTDELQFTGSPVEELQDLRRAAVDALFGCTFAEANASGRAHQYLDFDSDFATADEVLAERFGDPRRFGSADPMQATHIMRCDALIAAAKVRHGLGRAA